MASVDHFEPGRYEVRIGTRAIEVIVVDDGSRGVILRRYRDTAKNRAATSLDAWLRRIVVRRPAEVANDGGR